MSKPKIRTPHNYVPVRGKVFTQKSATVPEQSMSLKEIMSRYARGEIVDGQHLGLYESDFKYQSTGIHPATLDMAEVEQIHREASNKFSDHQREQDIRKRDIEQQEIEKKVREELKYSEEGNDEQQH